ncbi:MAG: NHLP bacteriocin export ABC transporter permease/ATPase subunit [Selenomonadaceae bacterium]|nr:NHLP bacteriocin export ABC transporter permease/ATPase subunit [Selenomonadaceae bacterium]
MSLLDKNILLGAGERVRLNEGERLAKVKSGKIEVYIAANSEGSFRQQFLVELSVGGAVFPSFDEFKQTETIIFANEDSELQIVSFAEINPDELKTLMLDWFSGLIKLPWLSLLADKGDDTLIKWQQRTVFDDSQDLIETFRGNEEILSMLLGVRFASEDKRFARRLEVKERNQRRIIDDSIANLLGEESVTYSETTERTHRLEEVSFVVRRAAIALNMPTDNIKLEPEIVRKLDQIRLMKRLIQKGNMQMRLIELTDDWHKCDSGTIIGYYGEEKTLAAFVPIEPGKYKLITQKNPEGMEITDEIAEQIDKSAFECYAGFPSRSLKIFDLIKFIFKQCWFSDYKTVILVSLVSGLIPLVMPIVTETIFADIIPILDRQGLATVTQVIMITSFTTASLGIVQTIAVMRITSRMNMATEAALWNRLLTLPTKFFRQFTSGELASRMGGISVIKEVVSAEFVGGIFGLLFSFWSIFLMCYYSLKLTAVAVVIWLIYSVIIAFIYRRIIGFQRNLIAANNKEAGIVQQIFKGLSKFREHGAESQAFWLWSSVFGETWKWNLALRWQSNYNQIIGSIQPFILSMALYYIAVYGVNEVGANGQTVQGITYAQFIAFQGAFSSFNATLNGVIPLVAQYFSIQPQIENLRPILNEVPESVGEKADAGILSGAIEVRDLTFGYIEGKSVLHDLNFKIAAGENVAIVGKSGCGKSTLVRLLLGFETPKKGAIYFDGQDMSELNLPSVRTQMGVVLQNGQLMQGDIFTNIIGTNPLTQEDAWAAAEAAGLDVDIAMMPMGMQTVISEGSTNISGGQRQRILIARALVTKPSILIFDEATSALDNRTQAIVTNSLDKLNATRIIVAHRLSTIRNCDRILVMDAGRIIENGSFDELIAQDGMFAKLVKRQTA